MVTSRRLEERGPVARPVEGVFGAARLLPAVHIADADDRDVVARRLLVARHDGTDGAELHAVVHVVGAVQVLVPVERADRGRLVDRINAGDPQLDAVVGHRREILRRDEQHRRRDRRQVRNRKRIVHVASAGDSDVGARPAEQHVAGDVEFASHQPAIAQACTERVHLVAHVARPVVARVDLRVVVSLLNRREAAAVDDGVACHAADVRRIAVRAVGFARRLGRAVLVCVEQVRAQRLVHRVRAVERRRPAAHALQAEHRVLVVVVQILDVAHEAELLVRLPIDRGARLVAVAVGHVEPTHPHFLVDVVAAAVQRLRQDVVVRREDRRVAGEWRGRKACHRTEAREPRLLQVLVSAFGRTACGHQVRRRYEREECVLVVVHAALRIGVGEPRVDVVARVGMPFRLQRVLARARRVGAVDPRARARAVDLLVFVSAQDRLPRGNRVVRVEVELIQPLAVWTVRIDVDVAAQRVRREAQCGIERRRGGCSRLVRVLEVIRVDRRLVVAVVVLVRGVQVQALDRHRRQPGVEVRRFDESVQRRRGQAERKLIVLGRADERVVLSVARVRAAHDELRRPREVVAAGQQELMEVVARRAAHRRRLRRVVDVAPCHRADVVLEHRSVIRGLEEALRNAVGDARVVLVGRLVDQVRNHGREFAHLRAHGAHQLDALLLLVPCTDLDLPVRVDVVAEAAVEALALGVDVDVVERRYVVREDVVDDRLLRRRRWRHDTADERRCETRRRGQRAEVDTSRIDLRHDRARPIRWQRQRIATGADVRRLVRIRSRAAQLVVADVDPEPALLAVLDRNVPRFETEIGAGDAPSGRVGGVVRAAAVGAEAEDPVRALVEEAVVLAELGRIAAHVAGAHFDAAGRLRLLLHVVAFSGSRDGHRGDGDQRCPHRDHRRAHCKSLLPVFHDLLPDSRWLSLEFRAGRMVRAVHEHVAIEAGARVRLGAWALIAKRLPTVDRRRAAAREIRAAVDRSAVVTAVA